MIDHLVWSHKLKTPQVALSRAVMYQTQADVVTNALLSPNSENIRALAMQL